MTTPTRPLVPGKWYGGEGQPRKIHSVGVVSVFWSYTDDDIYTQHHLANEFWDWATSGPHDTREQAEQAAKV